MSSFAESYIASITRLLGEVPAGAKMDENEIAAAEASLGKKLPAALREYYLPAGRLDQLNLAHNRLATLRELRVHNGKVVFCEENQGAVIWGMDMSRSAADDPPVYQSPGPEYTEWHAELIPRCSTFLTVMLHLQAVFGGLPCIAYAKEFERQKLIDGLRDWTLIHADAEIEVLAAQGAAIIIVGSDENQELHAGAAREEQLEALERESLLRWEWLEGD